MDSSREKERLVSVRAKAEVAAERLTCGSCKTAVAQSYFEVNGRVVCPSCRKADWNTKVEYAGMLGQLIWTLLWLLTFMNVDAIAPLFRIFVFSLILAGVSVIMFSAPRFEAKAKVVCPCCRRADWEVTAAFAVMLAQVLWCLFDATSGSRIALYYGIALPSVLIGVGVVMYFAPRLEVMGKVVCPSCRRVNWEVKAAFAGILVQALGYLIHDTSSNDRIAVPLALLGMLLIICYPPRIGAYRPRGEHIDGGPREQGQNTKEAH